MTADTEVREIVLRGRGPNTMSVESLDRMAEEMETVGDAPLLIRGEGDAFSAGLDLDALLSGDPEALLDRMEAAARRLFLHPAPTVACVNGHAIAGGCLLAIACDHRVVAASPRVRLGMTAVSLGLTYPPLILRLLRAQLPARSLSEVLLGAERFGPLDAVRLGVVDESADDPLAVSKERVAALARHPRRAYALTKIALREPLIEVSEAERRAFRERALPEWDPEVLRGRLAALRARP